MKQKQIMALVSATALAATGLHPHLTLMRK